MKSAARAGLAATGLAVLAGLGFAAGLGGAIGTPATGARGSASDTERSDWKTHWYDGRAEVSGYRLTQPRYGTQRAGKAVLIFVTERFSESARVKADSGRHPPDDLFSVVKVGVVKDFQTGIYDYHLMTTAFVGLEPHGGRPAGALAKLTFSAQEWCGLTFEEWLPREGGLLRRSFSYFDGEGDRTLQLPLPADGWSVDQLLARIRGLPGPLLAPGQSVERPLLVRAERAVLFHRPVAWGPGRVSRSAETVSVEVPAGTFEVDVYRVESERFSYRFDVEHAFPHRIVRWAGPDGEQAELLGSERLRYWQLSGEGDASRLKELGLPPQSLPRAAR